MNPSEAALDELVSLARQRGGISMEDVRKALPIDSMTVEDIARIVARLDEAGFDLEIDPGLHVTEGQTTSDVTPAAKLDPADLPEIAQQAARQRTSSLPSAGGPIVERHAARRSNSAAWAPALPWVLAFAIVVLAVFAAFAF